MLASPAATRLLLGVFVVACVQKEKRKVVIMKQMDPSLTITPVSDVLLVIGPTVMPTNVFIVQKDSIPMKPNRTVVKFVKQAVTIRIIRVLKV